LYGTLEAPLWRGSFTAQDLAVRSVADGVDFSEGQLRVRLDGQSLDIEEFTLQGAPLADSSGGTVKVTGSVRWPMTDGSPTAPLLSRLRVALVAEARGLRVSARVDRRLVVSGQLKTNLDADQLTLRGTLTADQALFILPEDSAPQLGEDVQVRRPRKPVGPETAPKASASLRVRPDVLLTLDLGQDFQVRGRGLSTRVAGSVTLRNANERSLAPLLRGELRTACCVLPAPLTTQGSTFWRSGPTCSSASACRSQVLPWHRWCVCMPNPSCPRPKNWPGWCSVAVPVPVAPRQRFCSKPPWPCWAARDGACPAASGKPWAWTK
jgi:hypothetical protein